jgi:cation diffusion facilitator family transporter
VAIWLGKESIEHLVEGHEPTYNEALPVAILGLVVNGASALILGTGHHFGHSHSHDHDGHSHEAPRAGTLDFNMRAAYIHILADALTSLLAIAALSFGAWQNWHFLDALVGVLAGIVIVVWAVSLCRQAARQLLDVVSSPTHEGVVRQRLEAIDDVRVADLHVWELGPGRRSCVVSLVTSQPRPVEHYRDAVLAALQVAHLTIEVHCCELPHERANA